MKTSEIKNNTDYIIGSPRADLFDHAGYRTIPDGEEPPTPFRMWHARVIDNRPHKQLTGYYGSERVKPKLVEGEKVDRAIYKVGPLVQVVKSDGTLKEEPTVVRPQEVRMEFDAWCKEWIRQDFRRRENRKAAVERRAAEEAAAQKRAEEIARNLERLNGLLEGSPLKARAIGSTIVLSGTDEDLLDAAKKIATKHLHVRKDGEGDKVFSHTDPEQYERDRRDFLLAGFDVEEVS